MNKHRNSPANHYLLKGMLFLSALAFAGFLKSCLPEPLPITTIPKAKEKLVISSLYVHGQAVTVFLSRTFDALEAGRFTDFEEFIDSLTVDSALVTFSDGNTVDTLLNVGDGVYTLLNTNLIEGNSYTLSAVRLSDSLYATATTTLLPQVSFSAVVPELEKTPFDTLITLNFEIDDPPGPNYYAINVQELPNEEEDLFDIRNRPFTYLLTDEAFDGQVFADTFRVFFYDFTPTDTVLISLTNVSKEYYEFLDLRVKDRYQLFDELAEPINYPSNVENGWGYFNLFVPDARIFFLEFLENPPVGE